MSIANQIERLRLSLPSGVRLLAVSKFHPAEAVMQAYEAGQRAFGESRVQELQIKYEALPKDIEWVMIGHLQTNKVRQVVGKVDLIQSVDSQRLLQAIQKEAARQGICQEILLEVNVGREESKSGFSAEEIPGLVEHFDRFPNICLRGLMAIPPIMTDISTQKEYFQKITFHIRIFIIHYY